MILQNRFPVKIFAFFGVAKATRSSRQFLELRPKAERIRGGAIGAPPTVAYEIEFGFFRKRSLKLGGELDDCFAGEFEPIRRSLCIIFPCCIYNNK